MELKERESLELPDWLRGALAEPFGETLSEEHVIEKLKGQSAYIITVGDETTETMLKHGIEPNLAIFDLKTHRVDIKKSELPKHFGVKDTIKNPPKTITGALWESISSSLKKKHSAIEVDGEEDLAALPCAYLAQDGAVLIYGIPDHGMSFSVIDKHIRSKAEKLLSDMVRKEEKI